MKVVVSGTGGTLGAELLRRQKAEGLELRMKDLGDDETVLPAVAEADAVVNASGPRVRPELGWEDYSREHVGSASRLVRAMKPGAHLVHVSSTAVFGARGRVLGASDLEAPTRFPSASYACAKLAAEHAVRAMARARGVRLTVLRPTMVYGPGIDSALASILRLSKRGVSLRFVPASLRQHLVHIDLFCDVVARALERPPGDEARVLIVADPFVLRNDEIVGPRGVPMFVPLDVARQAHRIAVRAGFTPKGAVDALAVLAIDNEFDWRSTFDALELDAAPYARSRTFEPYWQRGS